MKVLVTGAGSYIGTEVSNYIQKKENNWQIVQLDVQSDSWKCFDFSEFDSIFHVAGIAHRKITPENEELYFKVNRDLAVEIAKKAKDSGVSQFIFMSSMSVYSDSLSYINIDSPTEPDNVYGLSKLQAEQEIRKMSDYNFSVAIIRPPKIYGKGCKGNYNSLRSIALKYPFFPKVSNKRSMLYIDNLSELVHQILLNKPEGVIFPQNRELVNTTDWVKMISEAHGKKVYASRFLGFCARLGKHIPVIKNYCIKAFGDSYYDPLMSHYAEFDYQIVSFEESISKTEN